VVEVGDDSEAASIFENINDRGKPLSSLEKTKGFLMYMENRAGGGSALRSHINQRFGGIYRELYVLEEGHDRARDFDEDSFQQFHWGLYDGYDTNEYSNSLSTLKGRLHETYRDGEFGQVQSIIEDYTEGLREASTAFASLFQPDSSPKQLEDRLKRLLELGRLANVLPVLMAAKLRYGDDPEQMAEVVQKCETLVFRIYAIDGRRSNTGQGKLVRLAHDIHTGSNHEFDDTIRRLESITRNYTDDDRFERLLHDPDFYDSISSRDIRYLLYHYGQALEAEDREFVRRDLPQILSSEFQVEHILAQKLDREFVPDDLIEEYEEHVHRLGNLTIANRYWNSTYGALPFEEKKEVPESESSRETAYENSSLKVQKVLADIHQFDRESINFRENEIIEFALEEWSLDTEPQTMPDVNSINELLKESEKDAEEYSDTELAVMRALLARPGVPLRNVHQTAASFDESPVEWTSDWSNERETVQEILHQLKNSDLAYLKKKSWFPVEEEK
jgi:HEPN domain-containing protein